MRVRDREEKREGKPSSGCKINNELINEKEKKIDFLGSINCQ